MMAAETPTKSQYLRLASRVTRSHGTHCVRHSRIAFDAGSSHTGVVLRSVVMMVLVLLTVTVAGSVNMTSLSCVNSRQSESDIFSKVTQLTTQVCACYHRGCCACCALLLAPAHLASRNARLYNFAAHVPMLAEHSRMSASALRATSS